MPRVLPVAAGWLLLLGCAYNNQVWSREDGKNIRTSDKLTQVFLRDNARCEAHAMRTVRAESNRSVVVGRDTEYGGYGGVVYRDPEDVEAETAMKRASAYRSCMRERGYVQITAAEADERFGKQPEGFEGNF
jgi:hypothetical protein